MWISPIDVRAPRERLQGVEVLQDEGPGNLALAKGRWDGEVRLLLRWNGIDEKPLGHPHSHGCPTWQVLPKNIVFEICRFNEKDPGIQVGDIVYTEMLGSCHLLVEGVLFNGQSKGREVKCSFKNKGQFRYGIFPYESLTRKPVTAREMSRF